MQVEQENINTDEKATNGLSLPLREIRNSIVGSLDNKIYHLQNGNFAQMLKFFLESPTIEMQELNLIIPIIDSYIISLNKISAVLPDKVAELQPKFTLLSNSTLKILSKYPLETSQSLYENSFRLLATLKNANLFNIDQSFTNFISNIDQFLINDVLFQSICLILTKICDDSYYIHLITKNENLLKKLVTKFYAKGFNINMNKALIKVMIALTEEDENFSTKLIGENTTEFLIKLNKRIRYFDIELKILYIKLMTNIISYSKNSKIKTVIMNDPICLWSVSILLDLIDVENQKESLSIHNKIECVNALSNLLKNSISFQTKFYNLNGINTITNQLKSLYNENEMKAIEEKGKALKINKSKEKFVFTTNKEEDTILSNDPVLDPKNELKKSLIECLANSSSLKEESRKKIIDQKEIYIVLDIITDPNSPSKLLLASVLLILSLSRGDNAIKKFLLEHDINSLLFKLSTHSNVDIQIQSTNSLCNFLLESSNSQSEILECVNKLIKIFKTTTHKKIRFNSVFALKNILYSFNSNKEVKKNIMSKFTYKTLLSLLDDPDIDIQEQALLIFRVLLYRTPDDVEEVFDNCKDQLLKTIYNKLTDEKSPIDIITHSLYVISNISMGNNKHKASIDSKFITKVIQFGSCNKPKIRFVCMSILNNLMASAESMKTIVGIEGLMQMLEKIAFGTIDGDESDEYSIKDSSEAKEIAMRMIGRIKDMNKQKHNSSNNNN